MNIQIIGTKKCKDTKKAQMFFKERGASFHFVDLKERELSTGEWKKIIQKVPVDELFDKESKTYKKKNMGWMEYDPLEELLEDASLLKTPVVRNGNEVTSGLQTDTWKEWLK